MNDTKITFIGPGAMAEAIFAGLIKNEISAPSNITVSGPNVERTQALAAKYGVLPYNNNRDAVANAQIVLLSIKPQRLNAVMAELRGHLPEGCLVISIIAGATLKKLSHGLNHNAVVRTMPNTPSKIGEGITVWASTHTVTDTQQDMARKVLSAVSYTHLTLPTILLV